MMNALLKGGLLGGLTMFLWANFSWAALPWRRAQIKTFADEAAVAQVLLANAPERGVYVLPNPFHPSGGEASANPPRAFVAFDERSAESMARPMGGGLMIQILGGFCLAWLLIKANLGYWGRGGSATGAGLFAGIVSDLPNWNWWSFPSGYTIVSVVDHTLAGCLAGLVIAWAIQEPKKKVKPAP
jgi:hypothetical protein